MINLASPQVGHLLVAQTNGNGNEILRSVVTSLSMNNRRNRLGFVFVDSSRKAFGPLAGLPHLLRPVLSDAEETSRVLQTLTQEMGRRNGNKDPHIVVAIDDLMNLPLDAWRAMVQLVEGGNEAGIHVVAHLKKLPDEPRVNGLLKYQFPVRLLGQMSTTVAREGYAKLLQNDAFSVIVNGQERTRVCIASIAPRQQALVTCEILKRALIESQPGRVVARPAPREEIEVIRSPELRDLPYACGLLWKFGRYQVDRLLDHLLAKLSAKVAAAQGAR
jgi:hypothetical protein